MSQVTREAVIEEAQRLATKLGVQRMTLANFLRHSVVSRHQIYSLFPERGWTTVLQLAGLELRPQDSRLEDDELLAEFHKVVVELKRIPTWRLFQHYSRISADTIRRRFGGMQQTLRHYQDWLRSNGLDQAVPDALRQATVHEIPAPPEPLAQSAMSTTQWPKGEAVEYGAPIDFRGLRHAPINEQGVVYLFGMVSYELGFLVEAVHDQFPDCEAKRRVDAKRDRWQRVRIEFEYQSSNFHEHGHDPAKCDLIVCWVHNWPECPVEVLELRSAIDALGS